MGFHSKRNGRGTATLSMPRLYCARCGQRLKYQVVERGDWFWHRADRDALPAVRLVGPSERRGP